MDSVLALLITIELILDILSYYKQNPMINSTILISQTFYNYFALALTTIIYLFQPTAYPIIAFQYFIVKNIQLKQLFNEYSIFDMYYPIPIALALIFPLGIPHGSEALGLVLSVGKIGNMYCNVWLVIGVIGTVSALCGWSFLIVNRDHGPIQEVGDSLAYPLALPFALINAFDEEIDARIFSFRLLCLILVEPLPEGSQHLLFIPSSILFWLCNILQSHSFALMHVSGGFPRGTIGGVLVFVWAMYLGYMQYICQGILWVYILHVSADFCIALLLITAQK
eukprot:TRINITY_DN4602_c0_g1_i1.p1 TRINITY_DN4602_c0_g1~~TRINITY_DN4602_c0_g1_i1.p1  ORF type:complete len:281 (-),score=24.48 TRINITY_DN4602_c0_g1_i1:48-890(-)